MTGDTTTQTTDTKTERLSQNALKSLAEYKEHKMASSKDARTSITEAEPRLSYEEGICIWKDSIRIVKYCNRVTIRADDVDAAKFAANLRDSLVDTESFLGNVEGVPHHQKHRLAAAPRTSEKISKSELKEMAKEIELHSSANALTATVGIPIRKEGIAVWMLSEKLSKLCKRKTVQEGDVEFAKEVLGV